MYYNYAWLSIAAPLFLVIQRVCIKYFVLSDRTIGSGHERLPLPWDSLTYWRSTKLLCSTVPYDVKTRLSIISGKTYICYGLWARLKDLQLRVAGSSRAEFQERRQTPYKTKRRVLRLRMYPHKAMNPKLHPRRLPFPKRVYRGIHIYRVAERVCMLRSGDGQQHMWGASKLNVR